MAIDNDTLNKLKNNDESLTNLNLSYQHISNNDLESLINALAQNTHLKELNLSGNNLNDTAISIIAQIKVEKLFLAENNVTASGAEILSHNINIIYLDLSFNEIGVAGALSLGLNTILQSLFLNCNNISTDGLRNFADNTSLDELWLSDNAIDSQGTAILGKNKRLKKLGLSGNYIDDLSIVPLAQNENLNMLDISNNNLTSEAALSLKDNTTLRKLNISYNKLGPEGARIIAKNQYLKALAIASNQIDNEGIAALAQNYNYEELDLSYNKIQEDGDGYMVDLAQNSNLKYLNLKYNRLKSKAAIDIAQTKSIEWLGLSYNLIDDNGVIPLAKNSYIKHLDLTANPIGFKSAHALSKNTSIECLKLNYNYLGDKAAIILANNQSIKKIVFCYNNITDDVANIFAENEVLHELDIRFNLITAQGEEALIKNILLKSHVTVGLGQQFTDTYRDMLFLSSQDCHCVYDKENGNILYFSPTFSRILGYDGDELLGKNILALMHPSEKRNYKDTFLTESMIPALFYTRVITKNKTIRILEWTSKVIKEGLVYLAGLDTTDRLKLEITHGKVKKKFQEDNIQVADSYNRQQTEFIAHVCHGIRNPLHGTLNLLHLIQEDMYQLNDLLSNGTAMPIEKLQADALKIIQGANDSLAGIFKCIKHEKEILDDNLDWVKITENKLELVRKPFDLKNAIAECVEMLKFGAQEKATKLELFLPSEEVIVKGSESKVKQILINLITNAIKFTNNGKIEVQLEIKSTLPSFINCIIQIKDTGIGLTKEESDKIFQRFSPVSFVNGNYTEQGTSLGLFITKELITKMGGHIEVISEKNSGTSMVCHINFPTCTKEEIVIVKKAREKAKHELNQKGPSGGKWSIKNIYTTFYNNHNQGKEEKKPIVLVVEDNAVNQKVLKNALEKNHYTVLIADNGQIAVDICKARYHEINIIFMDILMPVMGGYEATMQIREYEKTLLMQPGMQIIPRIPIIAVSAQSAESDKQRALELGMDDYITKPIDMPALLKIAENYQNIQHMVTNHKDVNGSPSVAPRSYGIN